MKSVSVRHNTPLLFLIVLKKTLHLAMKFKEVYRILDIDAEKASVKNKLVDWPDAGVYNV